MERSNGLRMVLLRIWLYVLPSLFLLLASAIFFLNMPGDPLAPYVAFGLAAVFIPLQIFISNRLEKRFGLDGLPSPGALVFFLFFAAMLVVIGFIGHWRVKSLLGLPMGLMFLSCSPSYAVSFSVAKARQPD